jgi:hypothetical protein
MPEAQIPGRLHLLLGAFLLRKKRAFRSNPLDFRFNRLRGTGALETAGAVNYKTRTPAREF